MGDPIWYLLAEENRKRAKPMHRQERYAYLEGFLDAIEALKDDHDGTLRELLDSEAKEPAEAAVGPSPAEGPRPRPPKRRPWSARPRG